MSHTIIPFTKSNLVKIKNNQFLILKEKPLYTVSKLVVYDFDTCEQNELEISPKLAKY